MLRRVALIGRPNVGKSTLFNRLVGKALAIVYNQPGVTRDWREHKVTLEGATFLLVDTPGFELDEAKRADHIVFVCDAKEGILPPDLDLLKSIRRFIAGKQVTLVLNKAEKEPEAWLLAEAHQLGYTPIVISALHGQGMDELIATLMHHMPIHPPEEEVELEETPALPNVVIAGQPNSGKSTLMNALLGEERMRVGPQAGLTRDVINAQTKLGALSIMLADTPGLRRKGKVKDALETLSWQEAMRAIQFAHVVILLIDATTPFEAQDLRMARHVMDEGRAIVLALNKWDLIQDKQKTLKHFQEEWDSLFPQCRGVPLLPISALEKSGLSALPRQIQASYKAWTKILKTSELNHWLKAATTHHLPPRLPGNKLLTLKYITQIKARPPTFVLFTNVDTRSLSASALSLVRGYERYLMNSLVKAFQLLGTPVRMNLRFKE